jgi:hypothetical protein
MNIFRTKNPMLLIVAALVFCTGVFGQGDGSSTKPLFQDLKVYTPTPDSSNSFVKKTGSATPSMGEPGKSS